MPISVTCPSCQTAFRLPDEMAGQKVTCQNCQSAITVPGAKKTQSPRDTAIAAGEKRNTHIKSDPESSTRLKKPTRPAPKAKSGGGCMMLLLVLFLGGSLFGCVGCGVLGWWLYDSGDGKVVLKDKKDGFVFVDKIDFDKKIDFGKDMPIFDKKDDRGIFDKKDLDKKEDPFKDRPPFDGKKDDRPLFDGKKDDAVKDKDGPPRFDGPPKDGFDPFKDKKEIKPPPPGLRHVVFDPTGTYVANDSVRTTDPLGRSGSKHKSYTADLDVGTTYEIDLRRPGSLQIGLVVVDDKQNAVAQSDNTRQANSQTLLFRPARSGRYIIEASDGASKAKIPYTFTVRKCDNVPVGPGFRVGFHHFKMENQPGAIGSTRPVPDLVWASDGKSFYAMTPDGILQQMNIDTGAVMQQHNFRTRCKNMVMSAEGLVLAMDDREVWVLDPANVGKVKKVILAPGVNRVAAGRDVSFAVATIRNQGFDKDGLAVLDLRGGVIASHFKAQPNSYLRTSRDGKIVIAGDVNEPMKRYRCDGMTLTLEETSDYRVGVAREMRLSPDDQLVWLHGGTPKTGKDAALFHVANLKKPAFTIAGDNQTPAIAAVDPQSGYFYGVGDSFHVIVYTPNGNKRAEFRIPTFEANAGDNEIAVSPLGGELLIQGDHHVAYVKILTPGEQLARIDPKIDPRIDPKDPPKDPKDPKEEPKVKEEPKKVRPLQKDDIVHRVQTLKGGDGPAKSPVWSADGKSYFVLWQSGMLQRINAETGAVEKEHAIATGAPEASLGMSAEGLVIALPRDKAVLLVDPDDLTMVKKRITVAGVGRLATSPESKSAVVVVAGVKTSNLRVIDLTAGEAGAGIPFKTQTLYMKMSPDGKALFFADNGKLFRYRFDGSNVTYEENTYTLVTNSLGVHISPDSQYVSLAGAIAAPPPDHPGRELFAFSTSAMKKPAIALPKLDFPRAVAIDTTANWIYTNDTKRSLIIYNMAGIKQGEFPLGDVDAATSFEFLVSPMGQEFLIRTSTSVVHVKVKLSGAPTAIVKDDGKQPGPKNDKLVSVVTKTQKLGAFRLEELSLVSPRFGGFGGRSTPPVWDAQGKNLYWLTDDNLYKLTRDHKIAASVLLPQRSQHLAVTNAGVLTSPPPGNEVWLLDLATLAVKSKYPSNPIGMVGASTSPNAILQLGDLSMLDAATGKTFKPVMNNPPVGLDPARSITMSQDGKYLIVQGGDQSIHRFRVNGNQLTLEASKAGAANIQVQISPDNRYVVFLGAGGGFGGPFIGKGGKGGTEIYAMDAWKNPAYIIPDRLRLLAFDSSGRLWASVNPFSVRYYANPVKAPLVFQEIPVGFSPTRLLTAPQSNGCLVLGPNNSVWIEPGGKN